MTANAVDVPVRAQARQRPDSAISTYFAVSP